jgi:hypothetical protein
MSRGAGKIERAILEQVERGEMRGYRNRPSYVSVTSTDILVSCYRDTNYEARIPDGQFTAAQRNAVTRAMRKFVTDSGRTFALAGGNGRRELAIFKPSDAASVLWAEQFEARGVSSLIGSKRLPIGTFSSVAIA